MSVRENMIDYILTQTPVEFGGKENWLGVKMSPHSSMEFVNKVDRDGVTTSYKSYGWDDVADPIIQTIYQRLKLYERIGRPDNSVGRDG